MSQTTIHATRAAAFRSYALVIERIVRACYAAGVRQRAADSILLEVVKMEVPL